MCSCATRSPGYPVRVAGLMKKFGGVTMFLFPVTPPTGGLELVGVVIPATAQVKYSPTIQRITNLNPPSVFAECKACGWVVWVWGNFPFVAVRLRTFGWLDIVLLNDNFLAIFANKNNCHRVGVYSVADVCAVSDYWLRSFFGFHCVPFRGTRLQNKLYSTGTSDFYFLKQGEQVFVKKI